MTTATAAVRPVAAGDETELAIGDLASSLKTDGYAFVRGTAARRLLRADALCDWDDFARSWDDLEQDTYMGDGGRYRRRRFGVWRADKTSTIVTRQPHQPHWQGLDYNALNGGVERWFAPITEAAGKGHSLSTILGFCNGLFGALSPEVDRWHIEVHQFRIEARPGEEGRPTPEGMHRDGVDWVLVLMIRRTNIQSGTTTVAGLDKCPLGSFTLTVPFDMALVDDRRVYHGVTPVEPIDPFKPAHRDVLVVTFRRA
jgi:hypothetical protein